MAMGIFVLQKTPMIPAVDLIWSDWQFATFLLFGSAFSTQKMERSIGSLGRSPHHKNNRF